MSDKVYVRVQEAVGTFCATHGLPPAYLRLSSATAFQLSQEVLRGETTPGPGWPHSYLDMQMLRTAPVAADLHTTSHRVFQLERREDQCLVVSWNNTEVVPAVPQDNRNDVPSASGDNRNDATTGDKPTLGNPKDVVGSDKLPLHLWPATATAMGCLAFLEGASKYGARNYRAIGVRASIYVDAAKRHLDAWFEGEEVSPDTGTPHLSSALACLAILVDAQAHGKMHDDRAYAETPGYRALVEKLTPHVKKLKDQFADKHPKHYNISDVTSVEQGR
jgi:hypothetical protein